MTTVRRAGVWFEITMRRSGGVRLRHRGDDGRWVDHGDVCRWSVWTRFGHSWRWLHDGIFPAATTSVPLQTCLAPRREAAGWVVDRWLHIHQVRLEQP